MAGMKKTSQHYHRQVECMVMLGSGKRRSYLGMSLVPNAFPTKVLRTEPWTSLVVQWLRIHLPMQGTCVWSLEIHTPWGQLGPCTTTTAPELRVCTDGNYWSPHALEPVLCNKRDNHSEKLTHHNWRVAPTTRESAQATRETTTARNSHTTTGEQPPQLEKAPRQQRRHSMAENKYTTFKNRF